MSNSFEDKLGSVTYPSLLHMGFDEIGVTATLRPVYDGTGVETPLQISTTQVGIGGFIFESEGGWFDFTQQVSSPVFPPDGTTRIYSKTDDKFYISTNTFGEQWVGLVAEGESENGDHAIFDTTNSTVNTLKFNGISPGSNKVSMSGGGSNSPIIVDINPENIEIGDLSNFGTLASQDGTFYQDLTLTGDIVGTTSDDNMVTIYNGIVPITKGGHGEATSQAGFDALSPTTTEGDIIYHDGVNNTRLPVGAEGELIIVSAGRPAYGVSPGPAGSVITSTGEASAPEFTNPLLDMGKVSGHWYCSSYRDGMIGTANVATSGSITTGTLYYFPFMVTEPTTFSNIGIVLGSTAAGTSVFGIYASNSTNTQPTGSALYNSTSVTNTSGTFSNHTLSSPLSLSPGIIWLAFSTSGTSTYQGIDAAEPVTLGLGRTSDPSTSLSTNRVTGWSQSFTYSATLPSVGSLSALNDLSAKTPLIWLKVQ